MLNIGRDQARSRTRPAVPGLLLFAVLLLAQVAGVVCAKNLNVGDFPPDVFGKAVNGEAIHLADYRGKVVVISFWATWCGPCSREFPTLMALQKNATREKLVVLSVNWRQSHDVFRQIKKLLKDTDLTLISDEYGQAGDAYGVKAIPYMLIVGRDGKIAAIHVGYSEEQVPLFIDEINSTWRETSANDSGAN